MSYDTKRTWLDTFINYADSDIVSIGAMIVIVSVSLLLYHFF